MTRAMQADVALPRKRNSESTTRHFVKLTQFGIASVGSKPLVSYHTHTHSQAQKGQTFLFRYLVRKMTSVGDDPSPKEAGNAFSKPRL